MATGFQKHCDYFPTISPVECGSKAKKFKKDLFRVVASFTLISFLSQQVVFAQAVSVAQQTETPSQPVVQANSSQTQTQNTSVYQNTLTQNASQSSTTSFMTQSSTLQPVTTNTTTQVQAANPSWNLTQRDLSGLPVGASIKGLHSTILSSSGDGVDVDHDLKNPAAAPGVIFSYDKDASSLVESADFSALGHLKFSIDTNSEKILFEMEDAFGNKVNLELLQTNSYGYERVYDIDLAKLSAYLELDQIRQIKLTAVLSQNQNNPYNYYNYYNNYGQPGYLFVRTQPSTNYYSYSPRRGGYSYYNYPYYSYNPYFNYYSNYYSGYWNSWGYGYYQNYYYQNYYQNQYFKSFETSVIQGESGFGLSGLMPLVTNGQPARVTTNSGSYVNSTQTPDYSQFQLSNSNQNYWGWNNYNNWWGGWNNYYSSYYYSPNPLTATIQNFNYQTFDFSKNSLLGFSLKGNITEASLVIIDKNYQRKTIMLQGITQNEEKFFMLDLADYTWSLDVKNIRFFEIDVRNNSPWWYSTNTNLDVKFGLVEPDTTAPVVTRLSKGLVNQANYELALDIDGKPYKEQIALKEGANPIIRSFADKWGNISVFQDVVYLDMTPPVVAVTSSALTNKPDYTLAYTVDGVQKSQHAALVEGLNPLQITEQDLAGNQTNLNFDVTLDLVAPVVIATSVALTNKPDYTLTYTVDGVQKTKPVTLVEGLNTLQITEQDLAGNQTNLNFDVTLDSVGPNVAVTSTALVNKPDYSLTYTVDGVLKSKNIVLVEGLNALQISELDSLGNETKMNFDVTLDTVPPAVIATSAALTNKSDYTLTYTVDGVQKTQTATLAEGVNTLQISEQDIAGNQTNLSFDVTLDSIGPQVAVTSVGLMNKPDYILTYTVDGAQKSQPVTLVEGLNTLQIVEQDLAGNQTNLSFDVTLDTVAPVVAATSAALTNKRDYTLTYTVDGVQKTRPATLTEGLNTLQIVEQDAVGNQTQLNFDVTLDTLPPTVAVTSSVLTNKPDYTLIYKVDGVQKTKLITLVEGLNALSIFEQDPAGNVTNQNFNVTLDTIAPTVVVTSTNLTNKSNYSLVYTVDGTPKTKAVTLTEGLNALSIAEQDAAGNVTNRNFNVTLDTIAPAVAVTSAALVNKSNYTLVYTVDGTAKTKAVTLVEGLNTLSTSEQDAAGNVTNQSFNVILDTIAPAVVVTSTVSLTNKSNYTLAYTVDGTLNARSVTLTEGINTLLISEQDPAGNMTNKSFNVTLDTQPPTGTISINNGAQAVFGRMVSLNLTATDLFSGTASMSFSTDGGQTWTTPEPYSNSKTIALPDGDGKKIVLFKLWDNLGNESLAFQDSIYSNTVPIRANLVGSSYAFSPNYRLVVNATGFGVSPFTYENITLTKGWNEITRTIQDQSGQAKQFTWKIFLDQNAERGTFNNYDANGNITERIGYDGSRATYEYNANDQLTRINSPDGSHISFTYDSRGNRISMQDGGGTTNYSYDDFNRLTFVTVSPSRPGSYLLYEYDNFNRLTQMTYDGRTVSYTYDVNDRVSTVTEGSDVTSYSYNSAGDITFVTLPNGTVKRQTYDSAGRLVGVFNERIVPGSNNVSIASYEYTLDADGNRTRMVETGQSGVRTVDYTYDLFKRLIRETDNSRATTTYTYDASGNRLTERFVPNVISLTNPEINTSYQYGADNRLNLLSTENSVNSVVVLKHDEAFYYDAAGNLIQRIQLEQDPRSAPLPIYKSIVYEYNFENRLIKWHDDLTTVEFEYDGAGNRVGKRVNGVLTRYLVDARGGQTPQVLAESDTNGAPIHHYTFDPSGSERLSTRNGSSTTANYFLSDGLGSSVGLTNSSGSLVESYQYDAFGVPIPNPNVTLGAKHSFYYTGEQLDPETGLIYLRARYYDPALGRFLSRDPVYGNVRETQSFNPYPYVQNNPVNLKDPAGNNPLLAVATILELLQYYGITTAGLAILNYEEIMSLFEFLHVTLVLYEEDGFVPIGKIGDKILNGKIEMAPGFDPLYIRALIEKTKGPVKKVGDSLLNGTIDMDPNFDPLYIRAFLDKLGDFSKGVGDSLLNGRIDSSFHSSVTSSTLVAYSGYLGSLMQNSNGGITLSEALKGMGPNISDVVGAVYDPATAQLVLPTDLSSNAPTIPINFLITALRAVFNYPNETPSVSIDPQVGANGLLDWEGLHRVTLTAGLADTELGRVLFEADRLMKIIGIGRDNYTQTSYTQDGQNISESYIASQIPGFRNWLSLYSQYPSSQNWRFTFVPKYVRLVRADGSNGFLFDSSTLQLVGGNWSGVGTSPVSDGYSSFFTQHYDDFARLYPIFAKLKQAMRAVTLARFIRDQNIPIDLSWLNNATVPVVVTPRTMPAVRSFTNGAGYYVYGGASLNLDSTNFLYIPDSQGTVATLGSQTLSSRPNDLAIQWQVASGQNTYQAVALPLSQTLRSGSFQFRESGFSYQTPGTFSFDWNLFYDSFNTSNQFSGLNVAIAGSGWEFLPYQVLFSSARQNYTLNGIARNVYGNLQFLDRELGRTENMTLVAFQPDGTAVYRVAGMSSGSTLLLRPDGTLSLQYLDSRRIDFRADGRPEVLVDANNNSIRYYYDSLGVLQYFIDQNSGRRIQLGYDYQNRLTGVSGPDGFSWSYTYDNQGNLISAKDNRTGRIQNYVYDAQHHLLRRTDNASRIAFVNTYDAMGRLTNQVDSSGNSMSFQFDSTSRTITHTDSLQGTQTRQTYDLQFRLTASRDALGNITRYTYGPFGPTEITDARGNVTHIEYDSLGNRKRMIDPLGNITRYDYMLLNGNPRLIFEEGPNGVGQYFEYDNNGNVATTTRGVTVRRDSAGNILQFSYNASPSTSSFAYDSRGNLIAQTDDSGNVNSYTYDDRGNLLTVTNAAGIVTQRYTYSQGQLASSQDALGRTTQYNYDPATRQLTSITTAAGTSSRTYDSLDRLIQTQDAMNRLTQFGYSGSTSRVVSTRDVGDPGNLFDDIIATFNYDRFGNLSSMAGPLGGATSFVYDVLNRLVRTIIPEAPNTLATINSWNIQNVAQTSARVAVDSSSMTLTRSVIHYRLLGETNFRTFSYQFPQPLSGPFSVDLGGLLPGSEYEIQVELVTSGNVSSFSQIKRFSTGI